MKNVVEYPKKKILVRCDYRTKLAQAVVSFLPLIYLLDICSSLIFRLSFALSVSFLYPLYRVDVFRKIYCFLVEKQKIVLN